MPGAFDASAEFGHGPLPTAEEIQHSGQNVLRWLEAVATSEAPWPVDVRLVQEIHFRWFETTFPADAGRFRTAMVLNRKGSAVEVDAILPAVQSACENWTWRRERFRPADGAELIKFIVAEANTLAVRVYDVHPFIDGNTRATWHLRNYLLMVDGLRPLVDLSDLAAYEGAWWDATTESHKQLDAVVLAELAQQERAA
ncbi:MAG: Fic family protein [Solirubrobacterales bacterium]